MILNAIRLSRRYLLNLKNTTYNLPIDFSIQQNKNPDQNPPNRYVSPLNTTYLGSTQR